MDDDLPLIAKNIATMYRMAFEIVRREKGDDATMDDVEQLVELMRVRGGG